MINRFFLVLIKLLETKSMDFVFYPFASKIRNNLIKNIDKEYIIHTVSLQV